jgi:hypothetical protein
MTNISTKNLPEKPNKTTQKTTKTQSALNRMHLKHPHIYENDKIFLQCYSFAPLDHAISMRFRSSIF